jgi:WD40 repeat protein
LFVLESKWSERLVSGWDRTARVWHVEIGQSVCAVAYSPDGSKIATGGYDEYAVKVCDSTTGELSRVSALVLHSHNHHGVHQATDPKMIMVCKALSMPKFI